MSDQVELVTKHDEIGITPKVIERITVFNVIEDMFGGARAQRAEFTKKLVGIIFEELGSRFNVLTVNQAQDPQVGGLNKIVYHGKVRFGIRTFSVWGFDSGEFFHAGDGGWINWAMQGWFKRDGVGGSHVVFTSGAGPEPTNIDDVEIDDFIEDDFFEVEEFEDLE